MKEMTNRQAEAQIKKLRAEIEYHNRKYYQDAAPEISDFDFDKLMQKLVELEKAFPELVEPSSPSQRVGGAPLKSFKSVTHDVPMLSLDNTYSTQEVNEFDQRVKRFLGKENVDYSAEEKIDGVSISLTYERGVLVLGATRGDGKQGDDITENIKTIQSIPLVIKPAGSKGKIPARLELRAEAFLTHSNFQKINAEKEKAGEDLFANPRNAAAGSLKQLDPKLVAARKLDARVHGLALIEGVPSPETQLEALKYLRSLGFKVVEYAALCKNVKELEAFIVSFKETKSKMDYDVDGLVIKVNSFEYQRALRSTSKSPRWAIAYKYPAEQAETTIEEIRIQVGRTGALTPVALLKPVQLSGTTVSRASLHNSDEIERLDVRIGDRVLVEKCGEIIPKVVSVLKEKRKSQLPKFHFPERCPVCKGKAEKFGEEVAVRCINPACPAQLKARIRHFVQRDAMDIEGLGIMWIDSFVENGLIRDLTDIYYLDFDKIMNLERMGQKSTENLFAGIEASKSRPLERLIFGLGILGVGERGAHLLAQKFRNLHALAKADIEELQSIREMGPVTAQAVYDFFREEGTKKIISKLEKAGVRFDIVEKIKQDTPFSGKTIVITGTLGKIERFEAEALLRGLGAHPSGSVSKKTDFLVVGESAGSKLEKAKTLGVKILQEEQFYKMLRESGVKL